MIIVVMAVLGLIFGSFINALVDRLHRRKDWVKGRSECPHCHHTLAPKDLVPVLSWVSLGGKCRYCRKPIPDSPWVEIFTSAIFVLSYIYWPSATTTLEWSTGTVLQLVLWLVTVVIFVALAVYDLRWLILPDKLVWPAIILAAIQTLISAWLLKSSAHILYALLGAGLLSGLFLAIYAVSKGKWIGFGDVKLAVALGLLAAEPLMAMLLLFVASLLGLVAALPLLLRGKAKTSTKLPFGTLLVVGLVFTVLFGQALINKYLDLLMF